MLPNSTSPGKTHVQKAHQLGMSTSRRNDSHLQKFCRLSCTFITNTQPSQVPISAVFGTWKTPWPEIRKFFTGVRMQKQIYVFLFQKWSKSVQDKWPKGHFVLVTKKPVLAPFWPFDIRAQGFLLWGTSNDMGRLWWQIMAPDRKVVTFCVSRRRRKMYCGHTRLCLCVCVSVCLSAAVRPHYCTDPDVT